MVMLDILAIAAINTANSGDGFQLTLTFPMLLIGCGADVSNIGFAIG